MAERPNYSSKNNKRIRTRLSQLLKENTNYRYNAANDSVYSDYRTGALDRSKIAAERTVNKAKGINNGDTYSERVASGSRHVFDAKLNGLVPQLEAVDYQKNQSERQNQFNKLNALLSKEQTEYGRYRDDVAEWQQKRKLELERQYAEKQKAEKAAAAQAKADAKAAKEAEKAAKAAAKAAKGRKSGSGGGSSASTSSSSTTPSSVNPTEWNSAEYLYGQNPAMQHSSVQDSHLAQISGQYRQSMVNSGKGYVNAKGLFSEEANPYLFESANKNVPRTQRAVDVASRDGYIDTQEMQDIYNTQKADMARPYVQARQQAETDYKNALKDDIRPKSAEDYATRAYLANSSDELRAPFADRRQQAIRESGMSQFERGFEKKYNMRVSEDNIDEVIVNVDDKIAETQKKLDQANSALGTTDYTMKGGAEALQKAQKDAAQYEGEMMTLQREKSELKQGKLELLYGNYSDKDVDNLIEDAKAKRDKAYSIIGTTDYTMSGGSEKMQNAKMEADQADEELQELTKYRYNRKLSKASQEIENDPELKGIFENMGYYDASTGKGTKDSDMDYNARLAIARNQIKNLGYSKDEADFMLEAYIYGKDSQNAAISKQNATEYASKHPILASAKSIPQGIAGAGDAAGYFLNYAHNKITDDYRGYNFYNQGGQNRANANAAREQVSQDIANGPTGKAGAFLYQTGMSIADSIVQQQLFGPASTVIMGASAASDAARNAAEKGLSEDQVAATALVAGVAEWFFEKVELDQLDAFKSGKIKSWKTFGENLAKQAATEGFGEGMTDIANFTADQIINGYMSEFYDQVNGYMSEGMTFEEAKAKAGREQAKQVGLSALGGALSGVVMGSFYQTLGMAKTGNKLQNDVESVIEYGLDSAEGTEANTQANKALEKYGNDKKVGNIELAMLSQANAEVAQAEAVAEIEKTVKNTDAAEGLKKAAAGENITTAEAEAIKSDANARAFVESTTGIELTSESDTATVKVAAMVMEGASVRDQNTQNIEARNSSAAETMSKVDTSQISEKQTADITDAVRRISDRSNISDEEYQKKMGFSRQDVSSLKGMESAGPVSAKGAEVDVDGVPYTIKSVGNMGSVQLVSEAGNVETFPISKVSAVDPNVGEYLSAVENYGKNGVNAFAQGYRSSGLSLDAYTNAFNAFYDSGKTGLPIDYVRNINGEMLSDNVKVMAYMSGVNDQVKLDEKAEKKATEARVARKPENQKRGNVKVNENTSKKFSKETIDMIRDFAKRFNVNVEFFDSAKDSENGHYRAGTIYISNNSSNPAMVVAMHEYTHYMKQSAPAQYKAYRNEVINFLKQVDSEFYDSLAESIRADYKAAGVKLTNDALMDEIVANSTEAFVKNPEVWKEPITRDKGFKDVVLEFLDNFGEYLKGEATKFDYSDAGAEAISLCQDELKRAADLWSRAANVAAETGYVGDQKTQHSLNRIDSDGNNITKKQAEYFKNSKIVDDNGRLLVVYHGTPTGGFSVFKNDLMFFTANKEYADMYQDPSTSSRKAGKEKSNPMTYAGYLNIEKPFDISDAKTKKIFIEEYIRGGWAQGIDPYQSDAAIEKQIEAGIDWVEADNLKEFFDENGYDYDGIILNEGGIPGKNGDVIDRGTSYVAFNSNQFKDANNIDPTDNEDINYSIKKSQVPELTDEERAAFKVADNGRVTMVDARYISNDTWKYIKKKFLKLGYDFDAVNPVKSKSDDIFRIKEYFRNIVNADWNKKGFTFNDDQSAVIREMLGEEHQADEGGALSEKERKDIASKAEKHFGTTRSYQKAAYLTVNGKMLDFSEGQGYRVQDHREISEVLDLPDDADYSDGLIEFMNQGNIRMQTYGIDIAVKPNEAQKSALYDFFNHLEGEVTVDYSGPKGENRWSAEYKEGTSPRRILNDIAKYFDTDEMPQGTADGNTYYSIKKGQALDYNADPEQDAMDAIAQETLDILTGYEITATQIEALYKKMVAKNNSNYDEDAFKDKLSNIALYLNSNYKKNAKLIMGTLQQMAQDIMDTSKEAADPAKEAEAKDIKAKLRKTQVVLTRTQLQDAIHAYGSLQNLRRETSRRIKIASAEEMAKQGITTYSSLDQAWGELCDTLPGLDRDAAEGDMVGNLVEALNALYDPDLVTIRKKYGQGEVDYLAKQMANDMFLNLMSAVTPTDKKDAWNRLRSVYADKLAAHKEMLDKKYSEKLSSLRERYEGRNERTLEAMARQRESVREQAAKRQENAQRSKFKKDARKIYDHLHKMLVNPTDAAYIPVDLVNAVCDVCQEINFDTGFRLADGGETQAFMKLDQMRKDYESMRMGESDYLKPEAGGAMYDARIPIIIDQMKEAFKDGRKINDLTTGELKELVEGLSYIHQSVKRSTELVGKENNKKTYTAAAGIIEDVNRAAGLWKGKIPWNNPVGNFLNTTVDKAGLEANMAVSQFLSPERFARRLVGYRDNSMMNELFDDLTKGEAKMHEIQMDIDKIMSSVMDGRENAKQLKRLTGSKAEWFDYGFKDDSGNPVRITPAMRIALYLHMQNNGNLEHIENGGVLIPNERLYKAGKMSEAYAQGTVVKHISRQTLQNIVKDMTEYEKKFAKVASQVFNDYSKRKINETSLALSGYEKARVSNYFPISTDKDFLNKQFDSLAFDASITSAGQLKGRVRHAKNPIMLEEVTSALQRQQDFVSRYAGLAIPISNFGKVMNVSLVDKLQNDDGSVTVEYKDSMKKAIKSKWGTEAMNYIENMVTDLNGARKTSDKTVVNTLLNKTRGNLAAGVLTGNVGVMIKQTASYPVAVATLGYKAVAQALLLDQRGHTSKSRQELIDLIDRYTGEYHYRAKGNSTQELGDLNSQNSVNTALMKVPGVREWLNGIQKFDLATTRLIWKAAEIYVKDNNPDIKVGTDSFYRKVAEMYNKTIHDTQPNYATMQRPELLRTNSEITKVLTMFMTQRLQNGNLMYDSTANMIAKQQMYKADKSAENREALNKAKKEFAATITSQIISAAVIASMTFVQGALKHKINKYRDDEGNVTAESFWEAFIQDTGSSLAGSFLAGSELYDFILKAITGDKYYGISDNLLGNINDFASTAQDIITTNNQYNSGNMTDEKYKEKMSKYMLEMGTYLGQMLGIPFANAKDMIQGTYLHVQDAMKGEFGSFEAGYQRKNQQLYDLYYEAINSGDTAAAEKWHNQLIDAGQSEQQISSNMKKRLKDTDMIAQAAAAAESGDIDEYEKYVAQATNLGFDKNDVIGAVNSSGSNTEEKSSEAKPKRMYTDEMLSVAVADSDLGKIDEMREDYIASTSAEDPEAEFQKKITKAAKEEYSDDYVNAVLSGNTSEIDKLEKKFDDLGIEPKKYQGWISKETKEQLAEKYGEAFASGNVSQIEKYEGMFDDLGISEKTYTKWGKSDFKKELSDAYLSDDKAKVEKLMAAGEKLGYEQDEMWKWIGSAQVKNVTDNIDSAIGSFSGGSVSYDKAKDAAVQEYEDLIQAKIAKGRSRKQAVNDIRTSLRTHYKGEIYREMSQEDRNRLQNFLIQYCGFTAKTDFSKWAE